MSTPASGRGDLAAIFADPPREFSPVPIWWWSGEPVELERLLWQLNQFAEGGVFNVLILNLAPSGPLYGCAPDEPAFRSEAWWELFERVCESAQDLGIRLWFYDQLGFSGANLQGRLVDEDGSLRGWKIASQQAAGLGELEVQIPGDSVLLAASVAPLDGDRLLDVQAVALPVDGARVVRHDASVRSRLRVVYVLRESFDYLSGDACARLFGLVHGEFERRLGRFFGTAVVGSFQDELPPLPTWSADFLDQFRERAGYDLRPLSWALFDGTGDTARRVRVDYQRVRAELAEEAFFKPLFEWHERFGLLGGFDQCVRDADPSRSVSFYADYFKTQRWFGAPGSDQTGEGKVHSSMAHLYDRPRTWFEAFYGSGWGGTLEETFDWLIPWLRAGVNVYSPHAAYYATTAGWWEWAPPSTCWRQPYWRHYSVFSAAISRLCAALTQGHHLCDVAVLHPTTSIQADEPAFGDDREHFPWATSGEPQEPTVHPATTAYRELVGWPLWWDPQPGVLDLMCRDYDVVDESSLARATVVGDRLAVGAESYGAVVLPRCTAIEARTARVLCDFARAGGRVVAVGEPPTLAHGQDGADALRALQALFEVGAAVVVQESAEVAQALDGLVQRVVAPVPTLHRRVGDHDILFVPAAAWTATEQAQPIGYTFSTERYASTMQVTLAGPVSDLEAWDPVTAERRPVVATPAATDGSLVEIDFDGSPALLLVWRRAPAAVAAAPTPGSRRLLATIPGPLDVELEHTLDNRHGDFARPPSNQHPPVQTWSFEAVRGTLSGQDELPAGPPEAGWEAASATFGAHGWWVGPLPADGLPAPLPGLIVGVGLPTQGWTPVAYSTSRGIEKDPVHGLALGPKGEVPEEFLHFDQVRAGEGIQFRTLVWSERPQSLHLVIGANARVRAWVNGVEAGSPAPGYLWMAPAELGAGDNLLEIQLVAEENLLDSVPLVGGGLLRASWSLVGDPRYIVRPEWLTSVATVGATGPVRFSTTFELDGDIDATELQVAADSRCRVFLDGVEVGQQGGFLPYHIRTVQPYELGPLTAGSHTLECEVEYSDGVASLLVDGALLRAGATIGELLTGSHWSVAVNGRGGVPAELRKRQLLDPAFVLRRRRPHPLPDTGWLTFRDESSTVRAPAGAYPEGTGLTWLRWSLPPGARRCTLPLSGAAAELVVDGDRVDVVDGCAALPHPERPGRRAVLRVRELPGRTGGAALDGPITYELGPGRMQLGSWHDQGLDSYSGGVRYRTSLRLDQVSGAVELDLGRVVGTAQVWVNGLDVGARVMSPYRFDLSIGAAPGDNSIEILVLNTLGPFFGAVGPSPFVFPNQIVSGLFGPVILNERTAQVPSH